MASFLTDRQSVTSPPGKLHDESRQLELGASGRCPPCSDGAQFTERLSELVAQLLVLFGEGTDPPICKFESSTNRLVAGLAWTPGDYRRGKEVVRRGPNLVGLRLGPRDGKSSRFADVEPGADRSEAGTTKIRDGKIVRSQMFDADSARVARFLERATTGR